MNIKELESKDLDLVKWNTLLDKTPVLDAQYCQHWFVSSICNSWKAYILDDYKSAFICVYSKKKGVKIMYQPFYSRNFSFIGEANNKFVNTVIKKIENEFKLLQFNLSDNIKLRLWEKTELNYQILPLNSSYDNIYKTYSKNAKRILKKNNNILISESNKSKDFILLFKEKVGYKLKFTDENYMFLLKLIAKGKENKHIKLFEIKIDNKHIGFACFLFYRNSINYIKGALTDEGRKLGGMYYMFNHVVKEYSNQDNILDFGGSNIDSIASFYKKFGANDKYYYFYQRNQLSLIIKKIKNIRDKLK